MRSWFAGLAGAGAFGFSLLLTAAGIGAGFHAAVVIGLGAAIGGWFLYPRLNRRR